jgi:hypothetical protein
MIGGSIPGGAGMFSRRHYVQTRSGDRQVTYPKGNGGLFPRSVELPRREPDHSPSSTVEVKNACNHNSTPQYVFMAWCLIKQWIRLRDMELR